MNFKLEIDCGNAAFEGDATAEVARILRSLADRMGGALFDCVNLHDYNGNKVGTATFTGNQP
jgi:hypothetical protein